MDPNKPSTSMTNTVKPDSEGETNRNNKGTQRQASQNDNEERLFTSTPSQSSNFVPLNGTHSRPVNTVLNESGSHLSRSSENAAESQINICSTSQSVTSSKVNSKDSAVASSSRSSLLNANNGIDANEGQHCQRHRACLAGSSSQPSTSGISRATENENVVFRENRKRPSTLKLNRPNIDDDSSSDTGNDDYSLGSEDGCIYTYRGGEHLADLPSSFFSLDMGLPLDRHLPMPPNYPVQQQGAANAREGGSRASSPDQDFLEMDFDPGPSAEVDSGEESTPDADIDAGINMPDEDSEPIIEPRGPTPEEFAATGAGTRCIPVPVPAIVPVGPHGDDIYSHATPSTSRAAAVVTSHGDAPENTHVHTSYGPYITHVNARGQQLLVRRTMLHWAGPVNLHLLNGDLVPPRELSNCPEEEYPDGSFAHYINRGNRVTNENNQIMPSAMYHLIMAKKLMTDKYKEDNEGSSGNVPGESYESVASSSLSSISCIEPPRCMIWSEREACERQVTQIGTSACGATAVVNVFSALGVPVNIERINICVGTRLRANTAPIPRYLLSRSVAGCTAADIVSGIQKASDGLVTARFFPTYPERAMSLSHWIADWITLGAVPILTLNLQNGVDGDIPDAWHHQMVFGVSSRGIYLTNPVECVRETMVWPRLASPSTLLIRSRDLVARFTTTTDLTPLLHVPDPRFHSYNVLGQVVNVLREWSAVGWQEHLSRTRHIRIPAAYQAGITIAVLTGSEAHRRLMLASQLPILFPQNDPA